MSQLAIMSASVATDSTLREYFYPSKDFTITIDLARDNLLSTEGISMMNDRYILKDFDPATKEWTPLEFSPQECFARSACEFGSNQEHAQRLYDYASRNWFMFATPILSNAGSKRGMPISCFLGQVGDSVREILNHHLETGFLASYGGGVAGDWSKLRSDGVHTSRGNRTQGVIPFINMMDTQMMAMQQGATRRGAYAAYLDISHPEIEEFIDLRDGRGSDQNRRCLGEGFHHAVTITDNFMEAVKNGAPWSLIDPHTKEVKKTVQARDLWMKILISRVELGEPYIFFRDTANKHVPSFLKEKGLEVNNSNLCVAPETLILTDQGYLKISTLEGKDVKVWNGQEFSKVTVVKTAKDVELMRVTFSDGATLDCTPEHKFYIQERYGEPVVLATADTLRAGMRIEKFDTLPVIQFNGGNPDDKYYYSNGFYCGDGNKDYNFSWVYEPKYSCIERLIGEVVEDGSDVLRKRWDHGPLSKFVVPFAATLADKLSWLAGYFDADGCVIDSTNGQNIQVSSTNAAFLREIKLMLQTMGVQASLTFRRPEGVYELPLNDGSNESGEFLCKEIWLLNLNCTGVKQLLELGLKTNRLVLSLKQEPQRDAQRFVTVVNTEYTGRRSDTFCFTEPLRNRGTFNGILTGNCSEIMLPTKPDRTAVCCLSSVNLEYADSWTQNPKFISDIVEMLDNVLEFFINNAPPEMASAVKSAKAERSIGLGAMGFHLYLQKKLIPFESPMASGANRKLFTHIKEKALEASIRLAKERGEPEDARGSGLRFSHLLAVAPNASIASICGNTSPSIEPFNSNAYKWNTLSGSVLVKNKELDRLLKLEYGLRGERLDEVWTSIIINEGSVQHLDFMSRVHKEVFKTAFELDQNWIIEHASVRQEFICQGQSVNLFLRPDIHKNDLHKLHYSAWEKGLKALYYCRSKPIKTTEKITQEPVKVVHEAAGTLTFNVSACLSCEG